jgi:NAD(P)-dependent dehydrogenase (short-subunit alcohol dehydrogenase family)
LVTGAGSGIGRATALELAQQGFDVVATDANEAGLAGLPVRATLPLDVTSASAVHDVVELAGPVDVLVNAAGIGMHAPVELSPIDEIKRLMEVNFYGPLRVMQAVLPGMRARGAGTIVNVGSGAGRHPGVLTGAYSATKAALDIISEALAHEVEELGVRVVMVLPGAVRTNFAASRRYFGLDTPPYDDLAERWRQAAQSMLTEGMLPEEMAKVIVGAIEPDSGQFRFGSVRPGDDLYAERHQDVRRMLGYQRG